MLAAQFFQRHSGFRLFQDIHDLTLGEPRLLYGKLSCFYFAMSFLLFTGPILGEGYPTN